MSVMETGVNEMSTSSMMLIYSQHQVNYTYDMQDWNTNMSLHAFEEMYDYDVETVENLKRQTRHILLAVSILMPAICIFGILGNVLNLVILTRRQLSITMDRLEKSSLLGLIALAVSDGLYCLSVLPSTLFRSTLSSAQCATSLPCSVYRAYHGALINTFCLTSTWLTVIMAASRYLAICYPLHARGVISLKNTRLTIVLVFAMATLANLPRLWIKNMRTGPCRRNPNATCYMVEAGWLEQHRATFYAYVITWAVLGVFAPLVLVTFFSIRLIGALRQSRRLQKLYRANLPANSCTSTDHISATLIAIVVLFLVLTCPSEIYGFVLAVRGSGQRATATVDGAARDALQEALAMLVNTLLSTNFAINFILYFVVNMQFRKLVRHMLCCYQPEQHIRRHHTVSGLSLHHAVTNNTSDGDTEL